MPTVRAIFFASLRDATQVSELSIEAGTLGELNAILSQRLSAEAYAALVADNVRVALNQMLLEGIDPALLLSDGDEIAFLPPVTGG